MEPTEEVWDELRQYYVEGCGDDEWKKVGYLYRRLEKTWWQYENNYCKKHSTPDSREKSEYCCFKQDMKFMNEFLHQFPDIAEKLGNLDGAKKKWDEDEKKMKRSGCIFYDSQTRSYFLVQSKWSKKWSFPQGKINKYETNRQCAAREIREETGYDVDASSCRIYCMVKYHALGYDWTYYVISVNKEEMRFKLNKLEVCSHSWQTFEEIKSNVTCNKKEYMYLESFLCFLGTFEKNIRDGTIKYGKVEHFTKHSDRKLRKFVIIDDRMPKGKTICIDDSTPERQRVVVSNRDNRMTFGLDCEKGHHITVDETFQRNAEIENSLVTQYKKNVDTFGDPQFSQQKLVINAKPYFSIPSSSPSKPFRFDYEHLRSVYLSKHSLVCYSTKRNYLLPVFRTKKQVYFY